MNAHVLFPHIGKVIASTGSRHFPRMLHDLIQTHLAVDATRIRQLQAGAAHASHELQASQPAVPSPAGDPQAQLHLSQRMNGYRYVISVYRRGQPCGFSAHERNLLQDMSLLLLPMVRKHLDALQPEAQPDDAGEPQDLRRRFSERLQQGELKLSSREMQVCLGLLAGHTAPQLAEQLQLKVNTVESYLKRASIKLGIGGRHSLIRWLYASSESGRPGSERMH